MGVWDCIDDDPMDRRALAEARAIVTAKAWALGSVEGLHGGGWTRAIAELHNASRELGLICGLAADWTWLSVYRDSVRRLCHRCEDLNETTSEYRDVWAAANEVRY